MQDVDELATDRLARGCTFNLEVRTLMSGHRCAPALRAPFSAPPGRVLVESRRALRCHTEAALRLRTGALRFLTPSTKSARGSHHDQNVLTSRAACRSRPRQLAQIPMVVERRCHRGMNAELMSHPHPCMHPYMHFCADLCAALPSLNQLQLTTTPTHASLPQHHSILVTYLILLGAPDTKVVKHSVLETIPGTHIFS